MGIRRRESRSQELRVFTQAARFHGSCFVVLCFCVLQAGQLREEAHCGESSITCTQFPACFARMHEYWSTDFFVCLLG
jgi:hypothetical protein